MNHKLLRQLFPVIFLLSGCATQPPPLAPAIQIDPTVRHQTLEGWGTSLAWWANIVGKWPQSMVNAVCDDLTDADGLGMTVFRYNIHGGDNPAPHADTSANHFRWDSGEITSYKAGPDAPYDWSANAPQRRILRELLKRRPDAILEAIPYSPPYWMTVSRCSAGAKDSAPNLPAGAEGEFADFLTDVVKHYHDEYGITFRTLTGLNEPSEHFWKLGGGQEGCHVPVAQQMVLIDSIYYYLAQKDMLDYTGISAADENKIRETAETVEAYRQAGKFAKLSQINTHSYFAAGHAGREALAELMDNTSLRLWQSESGPLSSPEGKRRGMANYLFMAQCIVDDLTRLHVNAWVDWQAASTSPSWGFYTLDTLNQQLVRGKNYFIRQQFSRHLRPGSRIIEVSDTATVAALDPEGEILVLVVVNEGAENKICRFDLSRFAITAGRAAVRRTSVSEDHLLLPSLTIAEGQLAYEAPPLSVSTLLISLKPE